MVNAAWSCRVEKLRREVHPVVAARRRRFGADVAAVGELEVDAGHQGGIGGGDGLRHPGRRRSTGVVAEGVHHGRDLRCRHRVGVRRGVVGDHGVAAPRHVVPVFDELHDGQIAGPAARLGHRRRQSADANEGGLVAAGEELVAGREGPIRRRPRRRVRRVTAGTTIGGIHGADVQGATPPVSATVCPCRAWLTRYQGPVRAAPPARCRRAGCRRRGRRRRHSGSLRPRGAGTRGGGRRRARRLDGHRKPARRVNTHPTDSHPAQVQTHPHNIANHGVGSG